MVTFTGIGCGGADSFLDGVSMVDIRGCAFLPSDFGIRARARYCLYPEGLPGRDAGVVEVACQGHRIR
jgi:hypothetical protein